MGLRSVAAKIAHPNGLAHAKFARRLARYDANCPTGRIAAKESALGPFEHFDALNIHQCSTKPLRAAKIYPVNINAHPCVTAGLVGVKWHDAADTHS